MEYYIEDFKFKFTLKNIDLSKSLSSLEERDKVC